MAVRPKTRGLLAWLLGALGVALLLVAVRFAASSENDALVTESLGAPMPIAAVSKRPEPPAAPVVDPAPAPKPETTKPEPRRPAQRAKESPKAAPKEAAPKEAAPEVAAPAPTPRALESELERALDARGIGQLDLTEFESTRALAQEFSAALGLHDGRTAELRLGPLIAEIARVPVGAPLLKKKLARINRVISAPPPWISPSEIEAFESRYFELAQTVAPGLEEGPAIDLGRKITKLERDLMHSTRRRPSSSGN
jgi:hypothetical protein